MKLIFAIINNDDSHAVQYTGDKACFVGGLSYGGKHHLYDLLRRRQAGGDH